MQLKDVSPNGAEMHQVVSPNGAEMRPDRQLERIHRVIGASADPDQGWNHASSGLATSTPR